MEFIETSTDDGIVLISLNQISYVELEEAGCTIHLISKGIIYSSEMYEDIKEKILKK